MDFNTVQEFEQQVANFFGAPYGIAVDSCTHGVELCLRRRCAESTAQKPLVVAIPKRTYISIPFLAGKLNLPWHWKDEDWVDYYELGNTKIYDAAVLWKKDSYIDGTFMCLSFQFQKHLSLGRGGMILTDNKKAKEELKKMSYDGRDPNTPWREQNINMVGYHYYMTPEIAAKGLEKLPKAIETKPKQWHVLDWPDLSKMDVFIDPYLQTR